MKTWSIAGPDGADTLYWMEELVVVYMHQDQWAEMAVVLEDLIKRRTKILGLNHRHKLRNIKVLRGVYRRLGRWKDEQEIAFRVLHRK